MNINNLVNFDDFENVMGNTPTPIASTMPSVQSSIPQAPPTTTMASSGAGADPGAGTFDYTLSSPKETNDSVHEDDKFEYVDKELDQFKQSKYHWLYSGNGNNWWVFDNESCEYLESAYSMGIDKTSMNIMNKYNVTVFLKRMIQLSNNGKCRDIKRIHHDEISTLKIKGIAGTRYNQSVLI